MKCLPAKTAAIVVETAEREEHSNGDHSTDQTTAQERPWSKWRRRTLTLRLNKTYRLERERRAWHRSTTLTKAEHNRMIAFFSRGKKAVLGLATLTPLFDILQPISQFSLACLGISAIIFTLSFTSIEVLSKPLTKYREASFLVLLVSGFYVIYNLQPTPPNRPLIATVIESLDEVSKNVERIEQTVEKSAAKTDQIATNTDEMLDRQSAMLLNQEKFMVEQYYGSKKVPIIERNWFRLGGEKNMQFVISMTDGERVISDPQYSSIVKEADFDNNGYMDVAVDVWGGGNCCDPRLKSIFLNLGGQRFAKIEIPYAAGWEFYELGTGQGLRGFGSDGEMTEYIISKSGLIKIANFKKAKFFYDFDEVYDLYFRNNDVPEFVERVDIGTLSEPDHVNGGVERVFQGRLNENDTIDEIHCFVSQVTAIVGQFLSPCRILIDGEATSRIIEGKDGREFLFSVIGIDRMQNGRAKVYLGSQGDSKNEFLHLPISYD